jgi:hypothetical protein
MIKSDTLTILLSNAIHRDLDIKKRAIKIAKTCKVVRDRTKDDVMYNACKSVIKTVSNGNYSKACEAIELTEQNFYREYY